MFIVFEGIDGSGKTSQAHLLGMTLPNSVVREELEFGDIGILIRDYLKKGADSNLMAYLFAANRHECLTKDILPSLSLGRTVILSRYILSSLVYNGMDNAFLQQKFPSPDVLIYIDVPVDVALGRLQARDELDMYENYDKLQDVTSNYKRLLKDYKGRVIIVDGTMDVLAIHRYIIEKLTQWRD